MRPLAFAFVALTVTAGLLPAQSRGARSGDIPPGHRPPPGLCRIWIDGVPPGRQPAPTRCDDAERRRPANARVIYGSTSRDDRRDDDGRWDRDDNRGRDNDRRDDDSDDDSDNDRWDRDDDRGDRAHDRDHRDKGKAKHKSKHKTNRRQSSDVCYDRDRNGWCDWHRGSRVEHQRRSADQCIDRNRDGRCDDAVLRRRSDAGRLGDILNKH